jgi:protein phosphatase
MNAFAADSHRGHKRSHNEDCFLVDGAIGLFLVADGVGGHADGEVAAAIVRDTVREEIGNGAGLDAAIQRAHAGVLAEIGRREDSNMGSTVVAALMSSDEYDIAWVGDSRAYRFDGTLTQLTRDHNPVSEMLARGALTPEQAAMHPKRNVLSQSLGVAASIEVTPGRVRGKLHPGQQLVLCSDGLTDEVSDTAIEKIMGEEISPALQVRALIQAALDGGGRDNVTVVVVGAKAHHTAASAGEPGRDRAGRNCEETGASNSSRLTPHQIRTVLLLLGFMAAAAVVLAALNIF